jgi:hypothetical protein
MEVRSRFGERVGCVALEGVVKRAVVGGQSR